MNTFLILFSLFFFVLGIVLIASRFNFRLPKRKRKEEKADKTAADDHSSPAVEHPKKDPHHKKKGVLASIVDGIKGFFDFLWIICLVVATASFGLWFIFALLFPAIGNGVIKEAGGKGHPQYEARRGPDPLLNKERSFTIDASLGWVAVKDPGYRFNYTGATNDFIFDTTKILRSCVDPNLTGGEPVRTEEACRNNSHWYFKVVDGNTYTVTYEFVIDAVP